MLEPCEGKLSCTVLRGEGGSNTADLPDQLVEGKQKFISQIMTSKSPVRSAEDVDEVALSFAEVKMLATGDERFKEKMDLDMQVSKLRVLKQSYLSEHYDLEDRVLKHYPEEIKRYEECIAGYERDAALAEKNKPRTGEKFFHMTLKGTTYTEKAYQQVCRLPTRHRRQTACHCRRK